MSETATLVVVKNHTTRFVETVALAGVPASLVGKDVRMMLENAASTELLTESAGIGMTNEAGGQFWWEVTAANLSALGNPATITCYLTIFNADNSIFAKDTFTVNVTN